MIRKAILVLLTLGAVGMAVVEVASFRTGNSLFRSDWYYHSDFLFCTARDGVLKLFVHRCLQCGSYPRHAATCKWSNDRVLTDRDSSTLSDLGFWKFRWTVSQYRTRRAYVLSLPTFAAFTLFAAYPAIAFIRGPLRRRRRRKRGQCLRCAYSLEGNVSGVCPECGTRLLQANESFETKKVQDG